MTRHTKSGPVKQVKQVNPTNEISYLSGAKSTPCHAFHLIPYTAVAALADRLELGQQRKGEGAWNALPTSNQAALSDIAFIRSRIDHVVKHAYLALAKLEGTVEDDGDDDAAAIMWAGAFLHEAKRYWTKSNVVTAKHEE